MLFRSGARGVAASAGFSLISECMYLRKKMLLLPLANQYEQLINARYIEKLKLGISAEQVDTDSMRRFLDLLDEPESQDKRILRPDNERFFEILQEVFNRLYHPIDISV